ncbi:HET-domain-containing protein [Mytilinidion resinicola]|uniref:HET-domain-containing protein n=1 Tax=Mytilinidion resinicola TaxID=574789 RepID=A0A6A6YLH0_9PEZI|nr:HET-domain-containing protein [Mytilinidion resinicola]KAF2809378.1 HET-domain-containing protein [Mytilinidion resinicola]
MPLPKSLQPPSRPRPNPKRQGSCLLCNSLSPLSHPNTSYATESAKRVRKTLTLIIDDLALQKSKHCNHCKLICDALDAFFKDWRSSRGRIVVEMGEKSPVVVRWEGEGGEGTYLEIFGDVDIRPPWPTLGAAHPIPSSSCSDATLAFARRCLSDCLTSPTHTLCRSPAATSTPILPARLLDVGRVNAPTKLVRTPPNATPTTLPYATLSHCWGPNPLLSTTTGSMAAFGRGIAWEALPPLFRDAVILTRQLGLRYIWIDSLCIIQDSGEDWEVESAKMGAIYQASHVTLVAVECGNSNTPIFKERSQDGSHGITMTYTDGRGKEKEVSVRKMLDQHPESGKGGKVRPRGPLMGRAWALQEHVLAARVVLFTEGEVLFECRTGWRCECMPGEKRAGVAGTTPGMIPKALASLQCSAAENGSKKRKRSEKSELKSKKMELGKLWSTWHTLVAAYSTRALTHPQDKLPAISGLASQIATATSSPYLAGLWLNNLAHDLLWSSHPSLAPPHLAPRLASYRAPSFSWASVDTEALYYEPDKSEGEKLKSNIEVLDWNIIVKGENLLGEVSGGYVVLRGQVVEGTLVANKEGELRYSVLVRGSSSLSMAPDSLIVEDGMEAEGEAAKKVRRARPGEDRGDIRAKVLCLNVAGFGREWVSGLVLGLSTREPGAYERVGVFESGSEVFIGKEKKEVRII